MSFDQDSHWWSQASFLETAEDLERIDFKAPPECIRIGTLKSYSMEIQSSLT